MLSDRTETVVDSWCLGPWPIRKLWEFLITYALYCKLLMKICVNFVKILIMHTVHLHVAIA